MYEAPALFQLLNSGTHVNNSQLKSALNFIERGWPVLPLHFPLNDSCSCLNPTCKNTGKHPITRNGLKDASSDKRIISNWWFKHPKANIGILTGKESGIVVLDVDPRHGGSDSLTQLEKKFGPLPQTLAVKTGGDGAHYYFRCPDVSIRNQVNIRNGLDFRGDGGYIIGPTSIHASKKPYMWADETAPILDIPEWLLSLLINPKQQPKATQVNISNKKDEKKNSIEEGGRRCSLLSFGGFLQSKGLEGNLLSKALFALNTEICSPRLDDSEVKEIIASLNKYKEPEWPELQEFSEQIKTIPMTGDFLPQSLQSWCLDISERMQVPLEYVAGSAITVFGSVIGRRTVALPKKEDDWQIVPNLWMCVIAPPSSLKTPAMSAVLKIIHQLAQKARTRYLEEKQRKDQEATIATTEIEALKDALKQAVKLGKKEKVSDSKQELDTALSAYKEKFTLQERRYITNDPTIEKLLNLFEENPQGLLLFRDELSGWMETMNKSGREGDREFFLEAWNGDGSYSMDRVGRGTTYVDGICLSVLGDLQPGKFATYVSSVVKHGKSDDGFLQRLQILLYPERQKEWKKIDRKPDEQAYKVVENIINRIDQLPLPNRENNIINRLQLRYSESAQMIADEWHEKLERRLRSGSLSSIFESHLGKYRSLMPTLALIFTMIDSFGLEDQIPKEIKKDAVSLAIKWCQFLEIHALKAYGEYINPEESAARKLIEKIKEGAVKDFDKCRDIYRKGWKGLTNTEEFDGALKTLKKYGWLRTESITPLNGGRTEVIRLHPSLRFKEIA